MKKIVLSAAAVAILVGFSSFVTRAPGQGQGGQGQGQGQSRGGAASGPHKVGVIDMAEVFKRYEKFEALREDLKAEIEASDNDAKTRAGRIQALQAELQGLSKMFTESSPEYSKKEEELTRAAAEFESWRKSVQREFLRKEAQIYKTVYLEVMDGVRRGAEAWGYTLVLRFSRDGLEAVEDPQGILQSMNQQVVYFRGEDDFTDSVIEFLNSQYKKSAARSAPANGAPRRQ